MGKSSRILISYSAFARRILHIGGIISNKQMFGVDAAFIVAGVAHKKPLWYVTFKQFIAHAVRAIFRGGFTFVKLSVARSSYTGYPIPTAGIAVNNVFCAEPGKRRFSFKNEMLRVDAVKHSARVVKCDTFWKWFNIQSIRYAGSRNFGHPVSGIDHPITVFMLSACPTPAT